MLSHRLILLSFRVNTFYCEPDYPIELLLIERSTKWPPSLIGHRIEQWCLRAVFVRPSSLKREEFGSLKSRHSPKRYPSVPDPLGWNRRLNRNPNPQFPIYFAHLAWCFLQGHLLLDRVVCFEHTLNRWSRNPVSYQLDYSSNRGRTRTCIGFELCLTAKLPQALSILRGGFEPPY